MDPGGALADEQRLGEAPVAVALSQQGQDLALAIGQPERVCGRLRLRLPQDRGVGDVGSPGSVGGAWVCGQLESPAPGKPLDARGEHGGSDPVAIRCASRSASAASRWLDAASASAARQST